jgi:hypothetical protein
LTIHGIPDPETEIQTVVVTGHYDPEAPLLPPRDRQDDQAELTDPCVISPIATVCVVGKRPPLPFIEPPLPTGTRPWFPQWVCDFASTFCTQGQIPRNTDSDRDPPFDPSWPKRQQFHQCMQKVQEKLDTCKFMKDIYPPETIEHCIHEVTGMIEDCRTLYGPGT